MKRCLRPPQEVKRMDSKGQNFPMFVKKIKGQLALSQEDLARKLGVSYATR